MNNENERTILPNDEIEAPAVVEETEREPLDKNIKLMSPFQMVLRRFFRSRLSVVGLCMIVGLFLFCWIGPLIYTAWDATEEDYSGITEYTASTTSASDPIVATPEDNSASVAITSSDATISTNTVTWAAGENTVNIAVTNGGTTKTYKVVVTKS